MLLYGLFNSLRDSLMALAGIPFAAGGGILALYLSGLNFSISAAVGFVSLFGVSVMNGILIMTYYNEVQGRRPGPRAMFHAAAQRMRPMLMTALVGLHRLAAGGGFHRHRQSGAAASGHRGRRRHAHRPDYAARGRAGAADGVPWAGARIARIA